MPDPDRYASLSLPREIHDRAARLLQLAGCATVAEFVRRATVEKCEALEARLETRPRRRYR